MLKKRKYLDEPEGISIQAAPALAPAALVPAPPAPAHVHRPASQSAFAEKLKSALGRDSQ
jgi:hypothetical protein